MLKFKRLMADAIDYLPIVIILSILITSDWLSEYIFNSSFTIMFIFFVIFATLLNSLFAIKDIIIPYRSIGKRIMGLIIVDENNNEITDKELLLKRGLLAALTTNFRSIIINNKTISDSKYNTNVIEKKSI